MLSAVAIRKLIIEILDNSPAKLRDTGGRPLGTKGRQIMKPFRLAISTSLIQNSHSWRKWSNRALLGYFEGRCLPDTVLAKFCFQLTLMGHILCVKLKLQSWMKLPSAFQQLNGHWRDSINGLNPIQVLWGVVTDKDGKLDWSQIMGDFKQLFFRDTDSNIADTHLCDAQGLEG